MGKVTLNVDQTKAVHQITKWWLGNKMYLVLDSKAGTGKTFLVNHVLPKLTTSAPLLLCPTNESLAQLRDKTEGDYTFKTIASALGITPTTHKKDITFEHRGIPSLWEDYNLCIVDEASMVSDLELDLLLSIGIKILFLGHSSQLSPIVTSRKLRDLCISPVFTKGWETIKLTIPMRNTGTLWEFNNIVESMIYDRRIQLPNTFDTKKKDMMGYLESTEGKEALLAGDTKVVLWTNNGVDTYNDKLRLILFGATARRNKYLPGDRIILTKPMVIIPDLEKYSSPNLIALSKDKDSLDSLYSNAKALVVSSTVLEVVLLPDLSFACYKIEALCEGRLVYLYDIVSKVDRQRIADYYEQLAWSRTTAEARRKGYKYRHFILSCFADVKHYFAGTSHRLQGSSVPTIVVALSDIVKNQCVVERAKCRYVACSRAMNELMVYRGVG